MRIPGQSNVSCVAQMEQHGNKTTYNIETVLRKNIVDSEYWRNTCAKLQTWEEIVDQIFYDVSHVEPWMSGNARGASSAFGLLYRLCQIQPTEEQVDALLTHEDSPYIRAVGRTCLLTVCPLCGSSLHNSQPHTCCRWAFYTLDTLGTRSSCGGGSDLMCETQRYVPAPCCQCLRCMQLKLTSLCRNSGQVGTAGCQSQWETTFEMSSWSRCLSFGLEQPCSGQ